MVPSQKLVIHRGVPGLCFCCCILVLFFFFFFNGKRAVCMCMQVPAEATRGCQILWDWSYGWWWASSMGAGNHSGPVRTFTQSMLLTTKPSLLPLVEGREGSSWRVFYLVLDSFCILPFFSLLPVYHVLPAMRHPRNYEPKWSLLPVSCLCVGR